MLRRCSPLILAAALAVFTAGCSGSAGDNVALQAPSSEDSSTGDPMAASSPIGAFFFDDGGFDAAIAAYTIKVEEKIKICMADQGFEFAVGATTPDQVDQLQREMSEREWRSEYGYGISTSFDSIAQSLGADPNTDIMFTLSAPERDVWVRTLTGGGINELQATPNGKPLEEQGCIGQALILTGGEEAMVGREVLGAALQEGEDALLDRPEMIDVIDAWSRCMTNAGHAGFSRIDDPEDSISGEFHTVTTAMQVAVNRLSPEEGQALVSGDAIDVAELPGLDLGALRELQGKEIALALADLDCYEAEIKAVHEPLRDAFETGLLEEYSAEFNAMKNLGS